MTEAAPTILIFETTAEEECPIDFDGPSSDLVYFMSFAHAERYGADHPLGKAAAILKRQLRINLAPLLIFADARTEDDEEERLLDGIWQDPEPLARTASETAAAIEGTPELRELIADFPELPDRLRELSDMALWAAERGARVRLTYAL